VLNVVGQGGTRGRTREKKKVKIGLRREEVLRHKVNDRTKKKLMGEDIE